MPQFLRRQLGVVALLTASLSQPLMAEPLAYDRWSGPAEIAINARLTKLAQECAEQREQALTYDPQDIITSVDFNGDGVIDPVLDQHKVGCDGSPVLWSGTGGSPVRLFVSNPQGGWDEHTSGGFAGRLVVIGHVPVWLQRVHGTACNGAGALPCAEALIWGDGAFRSVADGKPTEPADDWNDMEDGQ